MKKIFFIFTLVSTPLAANAQQPEIISDATVQAAIKEFKPAFCQDSWKDKADAMSNCYEKTNIKDAHIHQCIIADIATQKNVRQLNEKYEALGKFPIHLQHNILFFWEHAFNKRKTHYINPALSEQHINATIDQYYSDAAINKFNTAVENCTNK